MDKNSYAVGMLLAKEIKSLGLDSISGNDFISAIQDVLANKPTQLSEKEAQTILQKILTEKEMQISQQSRQEGEKFLSENSKKEDVITLPSGLQYTMLVEGNGKSPKETDKVECHYEGRLINGTVFDSSYKRNETATFPLNGVIKGWTEGLQLLKEGGKMRLYIPYHLAYGEHGAGPSIPPYSTLIFDVELISVK